MADLAELGTFAKGHGFACLTLEGASRSGRNRTLADKDRTGWA